MESLARFCLVIYKALYSLNGRTNVNRHRQINSQKIILGKLTQVLPRTKYAKEQNMTPIDDPLLTIRTLPLQNYEDINPWIERAYAGETDVLWPGKVKWFSKSSGTTNARSKYIPVSKESLHQNHLKAGRDMLAFYLKSNPKSKLLPNSVATISGSIQEHTPSGAKVGDISAVIDNNLPAWANLTKALPKSILKISSWEKRLPEATFHLTKKDIRALMGVTSWLLVLLENCTTKAGKKNALELWPNLEVIFHGGVSIEPYRNALANIIPKKNLHLVEVFNASEGFFAFQDTKDESLGMLLACEHGIWYEFIDLDTKQILSISELELHKKYELVISTLSGLWRYRVGDVIKVTNLDPVRIKVSGRTKAVLNTFGEEVMVGNTDSVIANLNNQGYGLGEYTGTTIYPKNGKSGGHEWIIESQNFEKIDLPDFTAKFDSLLKETNSDYEAKRKGDIILASPEIHLVRKGTFNKWMELRGKAGGQNKVPRLSEKRELFENLLDFINHFN